MKYKKIVSTVLACALAVTTAFSGNVTSVKAEAKPTTPEESTLLGSYDFNPADASSADGTLDASIKMVNSGTDGSTPAAYTGQAVYGEGRTGQAGDKAIQLGQYGLELPQKNIGQNYTVSMWAKPTGDLSQVSNFTPLLFLGYNNDTHWMAVAAQWRQSSTEYNNNCVLWGASCNLGINEGQVPEPVIQIKKDEWTMITVSQSGNDVTLYRNGELIASATLSKNALEGEKQGIYIGTNFWDPEFPALVDDINVYDTALNGAQVRYLYDGKTEAEIFNDAKNNINVQDALTVKVGGVKQSIQVTGIPSAVVNAEITYTSAEPAKLEVNQTTGELTAKASSTAPITVTTKIKVGTAEVSKTTAVTVEASGEIADYKTVVDYDFAADKVNSDSLADGSGKNNPAKVHGTSGTDYEFIQEDGQNVMVLKSDNAYLDLPTSIMDSLTNEEQFTIETKFAKSGNCGNNAWLFCLGSKVQSTGTNYLFLSPNFGGATLRSGIKNSDAKNGEKLFSTSRRPTVDKYYTVSMVFDQGTIRLYLNGQKVQNGTEDTLESGYSIMDDVVTSGTENSILGYIGKSCWSADKNYQGKIASFRIYDGAMSEDDVLAKFSAIFKDSFKEAVTEEKLLGNNASKDAVSYNLSLPATYEDLPIAWTSTDENVISREGVVTCPTEATEVTLTAKVTSDSLEATKEITVTVVPMDKTALNNQLAEANAKCQDTNYTERSRNNLKNLIESAGTVKNQTEADNLITMIKNAINKLESSELFKNPFTGINDKIAAETAMVPKQSIEVFKGLIPADIKDMVTVTYNSSNPAVAAVNPSTGVVTAGAIGYARVTAVVKAKYDNFEMEYQTLVKVNVDMSGVTAKADADTLAKGGKTKITVNMASVSSLSPSVSYRATGAVSVDKSGNVTGKSAGTGKVYVKVTAGGKSVTRTVAIKVGDITGKSSVKVKKSITLKVSGITGKVKWSVDKSKYAKISQKGKLTAKKKGKVTVTAKVGKITMKKKITIKK